LIAELNEKSFKIGAITFIKKAMPLTVLTAILYVISLYFLSNFYQLNDAILKVIFIGLASLTFPHILLEYLLEKMKNKEIKVLLSAPRGFCAGVERAIEIVKKVLKNMVHQFMCDMK